MNTAVNGTSCALLVLIGCALGTGLATPAHVSATAAIQQASPSVMDEKSGRTPAQKKINSHLLYALYARRGESAQRGTPTGPFSFDIDARGRVLIDIRAEVTDDLLERVRAFGGEVTQSSVGYRSILARFPLDQIERLAALDAVKFIQPAAKATTHEPRTGASP
jgi:hypothetical protein